MSRLEVLGHVVVVRNLDQVCHLAAALDLSLSLLPARVVIPRTLAPWTQHWMQRHPIAVADDLTVGPLVVVVADLVSAETRLLGHPTACLVL